VDRLAELRESQALTLRDLAGRSGVDANTINQVELGHRRPRPSTLRKLAKALDVDVREFFEEPTLAGKAKAGAEPSVYEYTDEQRITQEILRAHGIEANDSEILVLNQYIQLHERPPTGPVAIGHVEKEGEPVDHERVRGILIVLLARDLLGGEEVEAVSRKVYAGLVSTA